MAGRTYIDSTATVSRLATIGGGTQVWQQVQVREDARIGSDCILGKGVYVDVDVNIGDRCKLENGVSVFRGATIEDGVFLGPLVLVLNDKFPRAINPDGRLKTDGDWSVSHTVVRRGASIGGGAVILPGITVEEFALVGAGAVVTKNVPKRGIVFGNPATLRGFACDCGHRLVETVSEDKIALMNCDVCGRTFEIAPSP